MSFTESQMLLNLIQPYSNLDSGINKGFLTNFEDLIAVPNIEELPTSPLNPNNIHEDVDCATALGYLNPADPAFCPAR